MNQSFQKLRFKVNLQIPKPSADGSEVEYLTMTVQGRGIRHSILEMGYSQSPMTSTLGLEIRHYGPEL